LSGKNGNYRVNSRAANYSDTLLSKGIFEIPVLVGGKGLVLISNPCCACLTLSDMSSDLTFITNEDGQSLADRFGVLLGNNTRFFDCLAGYGLTPEEIKIVEGTK
jgi:hypothetical protein